MPHATFSTLVQAPPDLVWDLLLDKVEHPDAYIPEIDEVRILERSDRGTLRETVSSRGVIRELVTVDEAAREVRSTLVDDPDLVGSIVNRVEALASDAGTAPPGGGSGPPSAVLTIVLEWKPADPLVSDEGDEQALATIRKIALDMKKIAESEARSRGPMPRP